MKHHLTAALTAAVIAGLVVFLAPHSADISAPAVKESAYERVMRTGVLRCGYLTWPRLHDIDPATGKMSGMWYDYVMTMAGQLNLKVEWAEEIGPGDFIAALNTGRIDAMCAPIGRLIPRMRGASFTAPLAYIKMHAYVRAEDKRFDDDLSAINTPAVRITSMEGEFNSVIAKSRFPDAQLIEFAPMLGPAQGYMNVAGGKADVVFADVLTIADYMKNNPDKLRAAGAGALGVFSGAIAVAGNEPALRNMLDDASRFLVETGVISGLIKQYQLDSSMRVAIYPYEED